MKINSINPMMYTQRTMNNAKKSNVSFGECDGACCKEINLKKGMGDEELYMLGNALKYFNVVENLSNAKVGSKFLIRPKDTRWDDINILITPETSIKGKDFSIGIFDNDDLSANMSFKGRAYGSIRKDATGEDKKMINEYNRFWTDGMYRKVVTNYASDLAEQVKDDYNFYTPTDGDGTRYKDITAVQNGVTKPSTYIPATLNKKNMSLLQATLTNFAKTGKLDDGIGFIKVAPAEGSAYAFLEGLKDGTISTKKPIVFCWGDNFSDIDITKIMLDHEKKNSAFTMTVIKTDTERVKSLSIIKRDEENPEAIEIFEEKPQDDDLIKSCIIPEYGEDTVLSAVGPYVLSPEALEWIKEGYTANPESFYIPGKKYDFSQGIIKPLLAACKAGEITDNKTGEPLKMTYRVKEDSETWSDLGSQKDFSKTMKDIKAGNMYKGLPLEIRFSVSQNVDDNGNITMNKYSRDLFNDMVETLGIEAKNAIVSDYGQCSFYGHA